MIDFTPAVRPFFKRRGEAPALWATVEDIRRCQTSVLLALTHEARHTRFGQLHGFDRIRSYGQYAAAVAVCEYPDIRAEVEQMIGGVPDILWPGRCTRFAQSSGTSDGKSKYIPITSASLTRNHYAGGRDVVAHYLRLYPDSRLFSGKSFILGGSFANEVAHLPRGVRVGDLSANLIENINPLANLVRVPSKKVALMADWTEKLPALIAASAGEDITNISGVPSWFLTVLRGVLARQGVSSIHEVWPRLEVFFHGGISFAPYRSQYEAITDPARMRYLETYNASEGFFAVQDLREPGSMLLLLDIGVFYEFVPLDQVGEPHPRALAAWEVEEGATYALVITACNGLWRYAIGDTVRIESAAPLRISIAGRTKSFINAFGEELMVHNAEAAMAMVCSQTGARVANYTAAPVYAADGRRGRHQWLIEWNTLPPAGVEDFADRLDRALQQVNSDYQAKRSGGIFLDRLSIVTASEGLFDRWLASTGKLGGQRKVPRLSNSRTIIDAMLRMNDE